MALQPTSSQPTSDWKLDMSTAYLLKQIATDVQKYAPTAKVSISPDSTWTKALAVALRSLEDEDQATLIFPETSKEQREAIKKLVLSQKHVPPGPSASTGRRIRTPFPNDISPPPPRPGGKARIRELAKEALAEPYRQPYTLDIRAALGEGNLATVSGTLRMELIDAAEDNDKSQKCKLVI
jgi:hypothetical protein